MNPVRVAVIGAGRFGAEHVRALRSVDDAILVGIADRDATRAAALASAANVASFVDVDKLLMTTQPALVTVAVPAAARGDMVEKLSARGVAILVEKPFAADGDTARRLGDAVRNRPVLTGHLLRFAEPYRLLHAHLTAHGGVRHGESSRVRPADHLVDYPAEDVVRLTLVHELDLACFMLGAVPISVQANGTRGADGRWQEVVAQVVAADGSTWACSAGWRGEFAADSASCGDAAVRQSVDRAVLTIGGVSVAHWPSADHVYDAALRDELAHAVACARDGVPSELLRIDDAVRTVTLVDAVLVSLEDHGRPVDVH